MADKVKLAHGNGGRLMHEVIEVFRSRLSNPVLDEMADAAELDVPEGRLAFSTDSFVIRPPVFPGGDIGKLAVCGTVNDIAMKGANPLFLSLALILEEGTEFSLLDKISASIARTAQEAGVRVVTGDVKVVEKGACDKIFINTSGVGVILNSDLNIGSRARPGEVIIINGSVAEHGMAILNAREEMGFSSEIKSDCALLDSAVERCVQAVPEISVMRDPTRGGLATALNEIAAVSDLGIEIYEDDVPVRDDVRKLCGILGFDPLYVANEGKFICFAPEEKAEEIIKAMGPEAGKIGRTVPEHKGEVHLVTSLGTARVLPLLEQDQLPRIC